MFVLIAVALVAVLYTRLSGGDQTPAETAAAADTSSAPAVGATSAPAADASSTPAAPRPDPAVADTLVDEAPSSARFGSALEQQVATVPDDSFESLLDGARPAAARQAEATDVVDAVPPDSLTLARGVVTLTYPATLALATSGQPVQVAATIPPCDAGFDYCFYLPEGSFEGSNFRAAGMGVTLRTDLTARLSCLLAQPDGYQDLQPGLVVPAATSAAAGEDAASEAEAAAGPSTSRFGDLGEGAAGTYYNGESRRLFVAGACYEFTTRVVESQFGNYPAGTVEEFTAEQRAAALARFDEVLASATVTLGDEVVPVEWPREGASDLAPFIRLDEPAAGDIVTSPLRLVGEAVGPWYFEGSFPVSVVAEDGSVLGQGFVTAQGEWMVDGFVPFAGEVEFEAPAASDGSAASGAASSGAIATDSAATDSAATGAAATGVASPGVPVTLVLARDNPSDLPEHAAALHVKVLVGGGAR